jgi:hypothetical protein
MSGTSTTTSSTVSTPNNQNSVANSGTLGGWFEVDVTTTTGLQHYTVNFALESKPFVKNLKLVMGTTNPVTLSGKIVDASGTTKQTWGPINIGNRYNYTFDISNLSVGTYNLDIYDEWNNKVKTVSFEKTIN